MTLFTLLKSWLYAAPPAFCITFYPVHLVSGVYGIVTIPRCTYNYIVKITFRSILAQWLIAVFFKLILNGDDIADADFGPVSIGFGVACFVCLASAIYTIWFGVKDNSILKNLFAEKANRRRVSLSILQISRNASQARVSVGLQGDSTLG